MKIFFDFVILSPGNGIIEYNSFKNHTNIVVQFILLKFALFSSISVSEFTILDVYVCVINLCKTVISSLISQGLGRQYCGVDGTWGERESGSQWCGVAAAVHGLTHQTDRSREREREKYCHRKR